VIEEDIRRGQVVARWRLEGQHGAGWFAIASGTTIGYKRIVRFPPVVVQRVRLIVAESLAPGPSPKVRLYRG
jgi:alpha-L-fucosidase